VKVVTRHRGVHLHGQFGLMGPFNRVQSSLPGTINAPETIVQLCRRAIQAQCQTIKPLSFSWKTDSRVSSGVALGVKRGLRRPTARILDSRLQVGTLEWIATSEHEHRDAHIGYLIDKVEGLSGGKFPRMTVRLVACILDRTPVSSPR
jgi:hypothetical protein